MSAAEGVGERQPQCGIQLFPHASAQAGEGKGQSVALQGQVSQAVFGVVAEGAGIAGARQQRCQVLGDAVGEGNGVAVGQVATGGFETLEKMLMGPQLQRCTALRRIRLVERLPGFLHQRIGVVAAQAGAALQKGSPFRTEGLEAFEQGLVLLLQGLKGPGDVPGLLVSGGRWITQGGHVCFQGPDPGLGAAQLLLEGVGVALVPNQGLALLRQAAGLSQERFTLQLQGLCRLSLMPQRLVVLLQLLLKALALVTELAVALPAAVQLLGDGLGIAVGNRLPIGGQRLQPLHQFGCLVSEF